MRFWKRGCSLILPVSQIYLKLWCRDWNLTPIGNMNRESRRKQWKVEDVLKVPSKQLSLHTKRNPVLHCFHNYTVQIFDKVKIIHCDFHPGLLRTYLEAFGFHCNCTIFSTCFQDHKRQSFLRGQVVSSIENKRAL